MSENQNTWNEKQRNDNFTNQPKVPFPEPYISGSGKILTIAIILTQNIEMLLAF